MSTTKLPQLRIEQRDLKCRKGCGFYGNAQFDGLCSKCFRERNDKKKKQNLLSTSKIDPTLPKSSQSGRLSPQTLLGRSPSKRQTPSTTIESQTSSPQNTSVKKKSSLVTSVFHKTLQSSQKISQIVEKQKTYIPDPTESQFILQLRQLRIPDDGKRKLKNDIQRLDHAIRAYINNNNSNKNIEELSDIVQNAYIKFAEVVNTDHRFLISTPEDREATIDFFEKVVMTQNHKFLFSPYFTSDEENDAKIQKRIRQLSWITAKHLCCSIDEVNAESRDLVYNAITELVGIDSYYSPQEKLECTVRCCRHIFELLKHSVGGPASADEFLPALIFVVLKANPVRLHSNINFITRFSSAARLMSGEGGYYFTNLCCAISFVENLNAESLNLPCEEFNMLMSGEKPYSTPWESALLACESLHLISENMKRMDALKKKNLNIFSGIENLSKELTNFQNEISQKVEEVLSKAPLAILPIKTPAFIIQQSRAHLQSAITSGKNEECLIRGGHFQTNLLTSINSDHQGAKELFKMQPLVAPMRVSELVSVDDSDISHTLSLKDTTTKNRLSPIPVATDQLFASPIFNYTPFDTASLLDDISEPAEELLLTPDFKGGLTNINYDFDLSDNSGDNSVAEEHKLDLNEFDPLLKNDSCEEVIDDDGHINKPKSLLESDSPPNGVQLPSPIKPTVTDYRGFSNFDIPTISCNTGDFNSLNHSQTNINNSDPESKTYKKTCID